MTCIICENRPAREHGRCANCQAKIDKIRRTAGAGKPVKFATYRGHVIGFYTAGRGILTPRLLRRKAEYLPKGITLNLDNYIDGFNRDQIKKIKGAILSLANS